LLAQEALRESCVPRKPIKIEIVREGDQRFLGKTFADGSEERSPIVKQPAKPRPPAPYRYRDMNKGRKRGF
jgi:hypothetical protein